jgi:hypothetical protein
MDPVEPNELNWYPTFCKIGSVTSYSYSICLPACLPAAVTEMPNICIRVLCLSSYMILDRIEYNRYSYRYSYCEG